MRFLFSKLNFFISINKTKFCVEKIKTLTKRGSHFANELNAYLPKNNTIQVFSKVSIFGEFLKLC